MSEPQHEQLSALLDTIYQGFTTAVAASRGKSVAEVGRSPGASCAAELGACMWPPGHALVMRWSAGVGWQATLMHRDQGLPSRIVGHGRAAQHSCSLERGVHRWRSCWSAACMT